MLVGYGRVSTIDQNSEMQEDALRAAGCGKLFIEKVSSGKKDRPQLAAALDYVRSGDTLVVWRLDRLARSLHQLIQTQGRRMKSAIQKRQHVLIIPGGLLAPRSHADPGFSVPPHEVDGDLTQDGQVASCRAIPDAAVILPEGDIEHPMQRVLNRPMSADRLNQPRGIIAAA